MKKTECNATPLIMRLAGWLDGAALGGVQGVRGGVRSADALHAAVQGPARQLRPGKHAFYVLVASSLLLCCGQQ